MGIGTRPISVKELRASVWLTGPPFLKLKDPKPPSTPNEKSLNTNLFTSKTFNAKPSSYFITKHRHATEEITSGEAWDNLLTQTKQKHKTSNLQEASLILQKEMQKEAWPKGLATINSLPKAKRQELLAKSPFLDKADGLIKVGCRLARADLTFGRKHPTLVPDNLTGDALIGYIHANGQHQGRKISSSLIREAGFCPVGGRRRNDRLVSTCIPCRTLRAPTMSQKMADLPETRLWRTPPFYKCVIDVFGHFNIRHGKITRASPGVQKVWVLIFTCLYSRAIHLEMLDSMDTASFKLAFNRFQYLRGGCVYLRSDAGSNFIGARNEQTQEEPIVPSNVINEVRSSWESLGKQWEINPPLASHFGGVWERAIGQVRQIIKGYILPKENRLLSREEFHTMLLAAAEIVNKTPLHDAPESPNISQPITPHHLITQRDDACLETYSRPTNYSQADLLAYGANRWNRIGALADEFDRYWKHYIYQIGN